MIKDPKYVIKITSAENTSDATLYTIQIYDSKDNQSWTCKSRFSELREIHLKCQDAYKKEELPDFPHRTLFPKKDQAFIQKRRKELENYYSTLLKSIPLDQLTDLLKFFLSSRPAKDSTKKTNNPTGSFGKEENDSRVNEKKSMKKIFDDIVKETTAKMVDLSNDFYDDVADDPKRKLPEAQRLKLDLKTQIFDPPTGLKCHKNNEFEYYASFFNNQRDKDFEFFRKVEEHVLAQKTIKPEMSFVVAL